MLAAAEYQRLIELAEVQTIMALAEERSSDVMEYDEAMGYIYSRLNLRMANERKANVVDLRTEDN